MKRIRIVVGVATVAALLSGCAGVRHSGDLFVAHGESFHVLGLKIPADELELARGKTPPNATETTVYARASDWTSVTGILNNIWPGFHAAFISGKTK